MGGEANTIRFFQQEAIAMDEGQKIYTPWVPVPAWVQNATFVVEGGGHYSGTLEMRLQTSIDQTTTHQLALESISSIGVNDYGISSGVGRFVRLFLEVPALTGPTALTVSAYLVLRTSE
jgi:hypothetical protein